MSTMDTHSRAEYNRLSMEEKKEFLGRLASALPGFRLDRMERFEAWGQITETAVYRYEDGAEFVYVPGDTVTLGWDGFACGMDDTTRENMMHSLEEYGVEDLETFLRENCSPVRTAAIPSMLVERQVREIGWYEVPLDHPEILGDEKLRGYLKQYQKSSSEGFFEVNDRLKLSRRDGQVRVQLYQPVGWEELSRKTEGLGFRIPSVDEWEYLCGGGSRTFWRWGDSFDFNMKIPHFTLDRPLSSDIRDPNQFGLVIAFDPYVMEVVSGPEAILKGGDGGCNICGGLGIAAGFMPVATYYKGVSQEEEPDYLEDIGGDYTSYRRILYAPRDC